MALDAETAAGGLIRKVQKAWARDRRPPARAAALCPRRAHAASKACRPTGSPATPARRLRSSPTSRRAATRSASAAAAGGKAALPAGSRRRDPQRRHAVPGRFGAGRAAGPQPRRALPVPPDLQDRARQGWTPADRSPGPATRTGATGTRRATSPSTCAPCRRPRRATCGDALRHPGARCAWRWRTGSRCCSASRRRRRQLEAAPAEPPAERCARRRPSCTGSSRPTSPSSARAPSSSRATPNRRPRAGGRQRPRRAARRRSAGAAPRQRAGGDDARGAPLLLRAFAAHHHQGQCRQPRAPARAHGLHRHQDLPRRRQAEGRDPLRRPVHLAGLCQPAQPDPSAAPQGGHRAGASGYPAASHAGKALLNILGHFPRDELFQIGDQGAAGVERRHPRPRDRPRVRLFARIDRFDRFVSCCSTCRAIATTPACASASARCLPRRTRAGSSRILSVLPRGPLVRVQFIIGRYAGPTPHGRRAELERQVVEIVRTWEDRLADAIRTQGEDAPKPCRPSTERLFRRLRRELPGRAGAGGHQAHRAPGRRSTRSSSISIACPACPRAASTPRSIRWARRSRSPSACRCWRTWASRPSTSAPITSGRASPTASATSSLHDMVLETADGTPIELERHDKRLEGASSPCCAGMPTTTASIG